MPFGRGDPNQVAGHQPTAPPGGRVGRCFGEHHRPVAWADGIAQVQVVESGDELRQRLPYLSGQAVRGAGFTLAEAGELAGYSASTLSRLENRG